MADEAVPIGFVRIATDALTASSLSPAHARRLVSPAAPVLRELPQRDSQLSLNVDLLRDVELLVRIELGRTRIKLQDALELDEGAVIELDRLAGDPVDVFVSDRLVARGEVVVIDDKFAIRLTEVAAPIMDD